MKEVTILIQKKFVLAMNVFAVFFAFYLVFFSEAVNVTVAPTKGMTVLSKGKGKKKKESESKKMKMKMKGMIQVITTNEQ